MMPDRPISASQLADRRSLRKMSMADSTGGRRRAKHRQDADELREIDEWAAAMRLPGAELGSPESPPWLVGETPGTWELRETRPQEPDTRAAVATVVDRPGKRPRRRLGRVWVLAAAAGLVAITTFGAEAWLSTSPADLPPTDATASLLPSALPYPVQTVTSTPAATPPSMLDTTSPVARPSPLVPKPTLANPGPLTAPTGPRVTASTSTPATLPWRRGALTGVGGSCIDIDGGVPVDGNRIQLWACNGTKAQIWTATPSGTLQVVGYCLRIKGGSAAMGLPVEAWTCDANAAAQQWKFVAGRLINPASGLCLTSPNDATANGTQLIIATCGSSPGQQWTTPPLM